MAWQGVGVRFFDDAVSAPLLRVKSHGQASLFEPEKLVREARRQLVAALQLLDNVVSAFAASEYLSAG